MKRGESKPPAPALNIPLPFLSLAWIFSLGSWKVDHGKLPFVFGFLDKDRQPSWIQLSQMLPADNETDEHYPLKGLLLGLGFVCTHCWTFPHNLSRLLIPHSHSLFFAAALQVLLRMNFRTFNCLVCYIVNLITVLKWRRLFWWKRLDRKEPTETIWPEAKWGLSERFMGFPACFFFFPEIGIRRT